MYKGTTPTMIFTLLTTVDLTTVTSMWVTIKDSAGTPKNWTLDDVQIDNDKKEVYLTLTQSEVNDIADGEAECQIRFLTSAGKAFATKIGVITIDPTLKSGVIS